MLSKGIQAVDESFHRESGNITIVNINVFFSSPALVKYRTEALLYSLQLIGAFHSNSIIHFIKKSSNPFRIYLQ